MVYTAQSLSLAQLELLVQLEVEDVLRGHWRYFPLEVAPEAILACESWAALPPDYASWPAPASTRAIGDRWIAESLSVGLSVPSAITPAERNLLLNPAHPGYAAAVAIGDPMGLILDRRLIKSAARPPESGSGSVRLYPSPADALRRPRPPAIEVRREGGRRQRLGRSRPSCSSRT